jgi:hypothetical protein
MEWKKKASSFFGHPSEATPVNPENITQHVRNAYALLCDANRRAIQVPADVVAAILEARNAGEKGLNYDAEVRFWNAYGLLRSSIRPAESARRLYRNVFYIALALLLFGQFFYLAGDYVRIKLADLDQRIIDVSGRSSERNQDQPTAIAPEEGARLIKQIEFAQAAYYKLSENLLEIAGTIADLPLRPFGFHSFFALDASGQGDTENIIAKGKLDMMLVFLSGYLLPMACTRFRRHRVRCFYGAGGGSWRDGSLRESSSLRRCA